MQNPLAPLQARMKGRNLTDIARRAGISPSKIFGIANNPDHDAKISTLMRLDEALTKLEEEEKAK